VGFDDGEEKRLSTVPFFIIGYWILDVGYWIFDL